MASLSSIEGIGSVFAKKLQKAGVRSTDSLLARGGSKKGRDELALATGISKKQILEWVNHADLFRVKGIGAEYADLLEEAGVDTVPELSQRKPETLFNKIVSVNEKKKLVRKIPTNNQVSDWVKQAKKLKRVIEY